AGIAAAGLPPIAVDFPGFGRSGGELTVSGLGAASLRMAGAVPRCTRAYRPGHSRRPRHRQRCGAASDARKGGGSAASGRGERHHVRFVAGSWRRSLPGSGGGRRDDTGRHSGRAARVLSVVKAHGRSGREAEITEYLDPWTDPVVARSWLALAG